jgi:hypothetical protein
VTVKDLLGHKTLDMTLRYAHLGVAHKATAVEALTAEFTPSVETPRVAAATCRAAADTECLSGTFPAHGEWQANARQAEFPARSAG